MSEEGESRELRLFLRRYAAGDIAYPLLPQARCSFGHPVNWRGRQDEPRLPPTPIDGVALVNGPGPRNEVRNSGFPSRSLAFENG